MLPGLRRSGLHVEGDSPAWWLSVSAADTAVTGHGAPARQGTLVMAGHKQWLSSDTSEGWEAGGCAGNGGRMASVDRGLCNLHMGNG